MTRGNTTEPTDGPDEETAHIADLADRFGDELLARQTPAQRAIADQISARLDAGENADDVFAALSATAIRDERARQRKRAAESSVEPEDETDWGFQWNEKGW